MMRMTIITMSLAVGGFVPVASAQTDSGGSVTLEQAATAFKEFKKACEADAGELWGKSICGPILLVDPETRAVVANQADPRGSLKAKQGVFVGTLPKKNYIANAPIRWSGVHWAMIVMSFLEDNTADRVTLLAHESFHRIQLRLGLMIDLGQCNHLDTMDGRVWMKLEWNALEAALLAEGDRQTEAIRDALSFREFRRSKFEEAALKENALELREGLAQYTGMRIAQRTPQQVVVAGRKRREEMDGIVRSYAYVSGPLYGYLLDERRSDWRRRLDQRSDLGAMLAEEFQIKPDASVAEERSKFYHGEEILKREGQRDRARKEQIDVWRHLLYDKPVLILDLSVVKSASFDTRAVHPFDELRTVFTKRSVRAEWGTLEVDGGVYLEDRGRAEGRLPLLRNSRKTLSGDGWTLDLNSKWELVPSSHPGDWLVRHKAEWQPAK